MAAIQVLCPNGRRQNVKITPNTKILQILEEVCKKQGFMPPEDYDLLHGIGKKRVDVTLSVRYANLPNNAKLELVKSQNTRAEQDVLIALQLETGERLQEKFSPKTSLWDLLLYWENKPDSAYKDVLTKVDTTSVPPTQPVCIYMREEVIGELAMKDTNLRKLGLTAGKAVLRLVHRPVDDTVMAEIIDKLEKEQAKMARLDEIARQKSLTDTTAPDTSSHDTRSTSKTEKDICELTPEQRKSKTVALLTGETVASRTENNSSDGNRAPSTEPMDTDISNNPSSQQEQPMETESNSSLKSQDANSGNNSSSKRGKDNEAEKPVAGSSSRGAASVGGIEALQQIPGVQIFTPQDFQELSPEEQEIARKLAARFMPGMGIRPSPQTSDPTVKEVRPKRQKHSSPFADFKFPEETKGKDLYHNEFRYERKADIEFLQKDHDFRDLALWKVPNTTGSEVKIEDFKPCERETVVYSLTEEVSSPTTDVPDEFFEVSEYDVKKMMVDLQKKVELMGEQPLMTSSMREALKEDKYSKYEKVVIRIQFPDKCVLQGLFRPRETVFAVQKFVKGFLENKNLSFYLYTSPPKQVLKDPSQTLIQASLVPATLVYFGSEESHDHYLSQAVRGEVGSRLSADKIVAACLNMEATGSDTNPISSGPSAGASGMTRPRPRQTTTPKDSKEGDKEPGVPKWFKIGKK